jgi:hypothetical protein
MPDFDKNAMLQLVRATEKNIETFEKAIREEREKIEHYRKIISELEARAKTKASLENLNAPGD